MNIFNGNSIKSTNQFEGLPVHYYSNNDIGEPDSGCHITFSTKSSVSSRYQKRRPCLGITENYIKFNVGCIDQIWKNDY